MNISANASPSSERNSNVDLYRAKRSSILPALVAMIAPILAMLNLPAYAGQYEALCGGLLTNI